jgi:hypothetical protein
VPCGPRSTSIRSRSKYSVSNRRVEVSGMSLTWMPVAVSQEKPTQRSPTPRMVKLDEVKLVLVKVTLGTVSCRSLAFSICWRSSWAPLKAVTEIGTSWSSCARRWAVTMICSP